VDYACGNRCTRGTQCRYLHDIDAQRFHGILPPIYRQAFKELLRGMTIAEHEILKKGEYTCPHFYQQGCTHINQGFEAGMDVKTLDAIKKGFPQQQLCALNHKYKGELNPMLGERHRYPGEPVSNFLDDICFNIICTGCYRKHFPIHHNEMDGRPLNIWSVYKYIVRTSSHYNRQPDLTSFYR